MKAGILAGALAAIATGVSAGEYGHAARRHAHEAYHLERRLMTGAAAAPAANATCGCTTIYTTITGEGVLYFPPAPTTTSMALPPSSSAPAPTTPPAVPTPFATTCPTPGVYTIPATTVTLTESTTVCAATTTSVPSGTHTIGGVTTVVSTSTTVVCPYATVSTSGSVTTSTILTTTYVCPSAGTYTIAPITTTVTTDTVCVVPTPASYAPGTYTQPATVTTITETDYVVVCPFTSPAAPTSTSVFVAPAPSSSSAVVVAPAPSSVSVAPASSVASSVSQSSSTSSSSGSSGGSIGSSGNQWAITYSPYSSSGACLSQAQVGIDIALIAASGFKSVRVYSTDCSTLEFVGAACKLAGLKMILGIFISDTGISGAAEQVTDIISWGQWSLVELVVIGNEAIFNGYCSASELASFISDCKSKFSSAGYSGQCTTTEPLNVWQANTGALCGAVDVVGCNIHPFFNADVTAEEAGSFTASQLDIVDGLCSGKTGINLETGWPSSGTNNGAAVPGASEQSTAVKGITESCGGRSVIFSYTNDLWKSPGAFDCEQSWGAVHLF